MPYPDAVSPFEVAYAILKQVIEAEFVTEGYTVVPDELHESLGSERVEIGIAPEREIPTPGSQVVNEVWMRVQWFDLWDAQINPAQQVNPIPITQKAERTRRAIRDIANAQYGGQVWYLSVEGIEYPRDPTGNKTRFVMLVRARGNNSALVETA